MLTTTSNPSIWCGQSRLTTMKLLMRSLSQTTGHKLALQINYVNHPHRSRMVCLLGIFLCLMRPFKGIKQVTCICLPLCLSTFSIAFPCLLLLHHLFLRKSHFWLFAASETLIFYATVSIFLWTRRVTNQRGPHQGVQAPASWPNVRSCSKGGGNSLLILPGPQRH